MIAVLRSVGAVFVLSALIPCLAQVSSAIPQTAARERSIADIYRTNKGAVVLVEVFDSSGQKVGRGSGFIVSSDGRIITNSHVLEGANSGIVKLSSGSTLSIEGVLAIDERDDLALMKVQGDSLPSVVLESDNLFDNPDGLNRGDRVVAIGSPLGLQNTVSDGIISNFLKDSAGRTWIQFTAPISPGNSGGPLLNLRGRVVGVVTSKLGGENLNLAIPIKAAKSLLSTAQGPVPLQSSAQLCSSFGWCRQRRTDEPNEAHGNEERLPKEKQIAHYVSRYEQLRWNGLLGQAEEQLRLAIAVDGSKPELHLALADLLTEQKKYERAIAEYRTTISLQPRSAVAYNNLGVALEQAYRIHEIVLWPVGSQQAEGLQLVLETYSRAYSLEANDPDIRRNYAKVLKLAYPGLIVDAGQVVPQDLPTSGDFPCITHISAESVRAN